MDFGFSRLNKTTLNFNEINELPIIGAQKSFVKLECESASLYMQQENFSKLTYKVNLPSLAFAPVKKGDVLGNAEIIFNDNVIKKINIVSEENIDIFDASEQGLFSKIFDIFIKIISKI